MRTVVKMIFGSHLYGLDTPDSDHVYKTVILPTKKEILLQQANFIRSASTGNPNEKNSSEDIDNTVVSYMAFVNLAAKNDTSAIDMLHAPESAIIESSPWWEELVAHRARFYTKNMKSYVGYVRKQAAKYGIKGSKLAVIEETLDIAKAASNKTGQTVIDIIHSLPTNEFARIVTLDHPKSGPQDFFEIAGRKFQGTTKLESFVSQLQSIYDNYGERARLAKENQGLDWKAISHALRAGYQARHIFKQGGFTYPLPETDFLMKVKLGQLDYVSEVQPVLEKLVDEVTQLAIESDYPDQIHAPITESFIARCHAQILAE